jgi:SAM-dependent methyltransferase
MPSPWIVRFAPLVPQGGRILDLACGAGRHARFFLSRGHPVMAIDRDLSRLADLAADPRLEKMELDLETGSPLPLGERRFAAVVVTNYLHRPLLPVLVDAVAADGLLLYETFAVGNERFGKPSNPDFLLRPGELLEAVHGSLCVLAYEDLVVTEPRPAALQRIAARRER